MYKELTLTQDITVYDWYLNPFIIINNYTAEAPGYIPACLHAATVDHHYSSKHGNYGRAIILEFWNTNFKKNIIEMYK